MSSRFCFLGWALHLFAIVLLKRLDADWIVSDTPISQAISYSPNDDVCLMLLPPFTIFVASDNYAMQYLWEISADVHAVAQFEVLLQFSRSGGRGLHLCTLL